MLKTRAARSGGGILSGMSNEKYAKITDTSKATATRYAVNVPGWEQPALKP
jgi:hypothetical protein